MNSLRLVETIPENSISFTKEETRAQAKAREAKEYFVEKLSQISVDFGVISDGLDLQYNEYYFKKNNLDGEEPDESETLFEGHIVYEPNEDRLNSEWQPSTRIIFGKDGGVYYQPQEYTTSLDHMQKCYPIDDLDRYDIKTNENAYKLLEFITEMTKDKIDQFRKRLSKLGEQVVELTN